jgi:hypothetical protein
MQLFGFAKFIFIFEKKLPRSFMFRDARYQRKTYDQQQRHKKVNMRMDVVGMVAGDDGCGDSDGKYLPQLNTQSAQSRNGSRTLGSQLQARITGRRTV